MLSLVSIRTQARRRPAQSAAVVLSSLLVGAGAPGLARGAPAEDATPQTTPEPRPQADPFAEPPPRDPDDVPFLDPPRNQLPQWSAARQRPTWIGYDDDHWVQLSATPLYASLHFPFIGRGRPPARGGGIGLELDVRLTRWLFLRAYGNHSVHPAFAESSYDEATEEVTVTANGGLIQVTNTGAAIVYALDLGRFVPRVDVGAGLLFVRTPEAAQDGQWGGECRDGGGCDLGLSCNVENICRPSPTPEAHAGIGVDILLGRRWAVGVAVRYFALLAALDVLPFHIQGSARLSVRF